jgi:glycosyltransferase involved in cell wall biosynthesis
LLLVDDGSTDNTARLGAELCQTDSRIRLLRQPHGGIVSALNLGLTEARGSLIARMDADDTCHPERLEMQVHFLERHPDIALVSCLVHYGGDLDKNAGYALHVDWINGVVSSEEIRLNRFVESPLAHPSVMFRRSILERHGGYREGPFPEDYELWLRWLEAGVRMAKVPEFLLTWNDPPQRLSRLDDRYDFEAFYRIKAVYLAREIQHRLAGRSLHIWGAGRPTRVRAEWLCAHGLSIAGYIDIDPKKAGKKFAGRPTIMPGDLPSPETAFVVGYVAKRGARELIRHHLTSRGYCEGRDFFMAA